MIPAEVVGRVEDPDTLPGGAALLMKAARAAGGWTVWATRAQMMLPVKVVAAKDSADGKAVYEDRPHERILVKGRRDYGRGHRFSSVYGGRRFVVQYLADAKGTMKVESAYVLDPERRRFAPASVAEVKAYLKGDPTSSGSLKPE